MSARGWRLGQLVRLYFFLIPTLFAALLAAAPDPIYRTVDVEGFEGKRGRSAGWTLHFKGASGRLHGYLVAASLEPTPAGGPQYLAVLFRGPPGTGARIRPPRPIPMAPVVREVRFFVYGFARGDELFVDLRPPDGKDLRIACGRMDFRGWKQLTLRLPPGRQGRGSRLNQGGDGVQLLGFFLRLQQERGPLTEARLYLDNIQAIVRVPYRAPKPRWDR